MVRSARNFTLLILGIAVLCGVAGCRPAADGAADGEPGGIADAPPAAEAAADRAASVIDIVTTDYAFTAPPSIPSGWVTLRLRNEAEQPHFVVLWRLPDDRDFSDYNTEVVGPFSSLYKEYRAGTMAQPEFFEALTAALPDWFPVDGAGGVALTSPGRTAESTVYLEPGDYIMECYVRAPEPDGHKFHSELGMLRPLIVTEESSAAAAPEAALRITLSNYEIAVEGELSAGTHAVAVHVAENPEGLIGHDVNLVRLEADTNLDEVAAWMSWVDGLQQPAPAEFLGGAEQVTAGNTSYFTVTLEPGRYAWVSEGYGVQGMVREFVIQ